MPFKQSWEKKTQPLYISDANILQAITTLFPGKQLQSYEVLEGGCANLNVKVKVDGKLFILRYYLRDPEAGHREQAISKRFTDWEIIPQIHNLNHNDPNIPYALTEFKPGICLRDVLLNQPVSTWRHLMVTAGKQLAHLKMIKFQTAGFFNKDLIVSQEVSSVDIIPYVHQLLTQSQIQIFLSPSMCSQIHALFQDAKTLLGQRQEVSLVHGDYDPANILVDNTEDNWQISALLDWEFAFAGDWLWDVANMLRYSHEMPVTFEEAFLEGLHQEGLELPEHWRRIIELYNISALLDCLNRADPLTQLNTCTDIKQLIKHFVTFLTPDNE